MLGDIGELVVSAANRVEAGIVVEARQGPEAGNDLHVLLSRLSIEVTPVDASQARLLLRDGEIRQGRHPAGLNIGDCFAYALAKVSAAPLLYKGDDFRQTDVLSAI